MELKGLIVAEPAGANSMEHAGMKEAEDGQG